MQSPSLPLPITVRALTAEDLQEATRICNVAFGTFFGASHPENFFGDLDYVYGRSRARHIAAFGATVDSVLVGSNFVSNWGSVGFFGPLSVRPDLWDRGVAKQLIAAAMGCFDAWKIRQAGLYTFSHSPKHLALYEKFGFSARFLTAILTASPSSFSREPKVRWYRYSELPAEGQAEALEFSRLLTDGLHPGLDLRDEIRVVQDLKLGDTILLRDPFSTGIQGFAICHCGSGTEAGKDACYVKFGAVPDDQKARTNFDHLLDACGAFARRTGVKELIAGSNLGRHEAYRCLSRRGFRLSTLGVAMHRPNESGYSQPHLFIIDDWR
jgi:GNAT superfamily N-acetyltransferase